MTRRPLVDECIARVGPVKAGTLATRIVQWSTVAAWLGHFPTTAEVSVEAVVGIATAERWSSLIRRAFTEDEFRSLVDQLVASSVAGLPRREALRVPVAL